MKQFVCLFVAFDNRQWAKSLPGETLEEFKERIFSISCIVEVSEGEAVLVKYWNNIPLTHSEWVALDRLSCTAPLPEEVLDAISDYFKYCD